MTNKELDRWQSGELWLLIQLVMENKWNLLENCIYQGYALYSLLSQMTPIKVTLHFIRIAYCEPDDTTSWRAQTLMELYENVNSNPRDIFYITSTLPVLMKLTDPNSKSSSFQWWICNAEIL